MMTEKEREEKRRKKTSRLVLVLFLVLIFIPIFLYLIAKDNPDRINRLYFAGYVVVAAAIYYSAQGIRRFLAQQKAPILETMLSKPETAPAFPQEYLDLTEQIKRSMQSRRYYQRSLARRLAALLESRAAPEDRESAETRGLRENLGSAEGAQTPSADPRPAAIFDSQKEPEPASQEPPAGRRLRDSVVGLANRFADYWDSLTGQGMPAKELQNIISSLKEL
jgi:hypothetical protein